MPKKKKGARNNKKNKELNDRELIFAEHEQVYGQIIKLNGDSRCNVKCFDGNIRMCKIRGKLQKRVWFKIGDIVLVSLRDYQKSKGDLIHKYTDKEARNLKIYKEIPDDTIVGEITKESKTDCVFDFDAI